MAGFTDLVERTLLDAFLGSGHVAGIPSTVYVGLFTASPSDTGGGTEVSGGSYARAAVANTTTEWPAASTSSGLTTKANANAIPFPTATAGWGFVTHFGIFDASTAGNLLAYGSLSTSKTVASADTPTVAAGNLLVSLD